MNALESQFLGVATQLLPYMEDESVTDLLINGTESLYVESKGVLTRASNPFSDKHDLYDFIERVLIPLGKRIDAQQPYLDGRLSDGSRVHIIMPPIALSGPHVSIRKFRKVGEVLLLSFGPEPLITWLVTQIRERKNILICGGTGSGKTTLMSKLLDSIAEDERLAVLEESREIQIGHAHTVYLEARPPSPDGRGEVSVRALIRNALRMRPDRIAVGECRGEEAFEMLQAMSTGHSGSLGTLHASTAFEALKRFESLVLLGGKGLPLTAIREWIASSIHVVVLVQRMGEVRRITQVLSVEGQEGERYRIHPRYQYERVASESGLQACVDLQTMRH